MVTFQEKNAEQDQNIKTYNKFFESVEQFKYLGTTLTYQNSIQKIKNRLKSGNGCCPISAEPFVFRFTIQKYKTKLYISTDCLLYCTGVKHGHSD